MNNHGKHHGPSAKAKDMKGTSLKLFHLLKDYKIGIILVIILAMGSTVFTIVGPKILGNITTEIFNGMMLKIGGTGGIDFEKINGIIVILIALYLASLLFSFIQGFVMSNISAKISYRLRKDLIEKINHLPMGFFDKTTHGEVLSRISNDVDTLTQSLNQSITQIITSVATLIGIFIMMVSINIPMAIVVLCIVPFCMFILGFIVKKSQIHFINQQTFLGNMNGHVEEIYGGHDIVKAFNGEDKAKVRFNEINHDLYDSAWKSQFLSTMMHPIMGFIGNLNYVVVSILGGYMVIKDKIQVGDILSFTQYSRTFMQQISQLSQIMNVVQQTLAASERVFDFLALKEEVETAKLTMDYDKMKGNIEFSHVHFGYDENKIIINDFSAKIKQGAKIAIVGPTGAGKSTIIKLLMRFYDVNSGAIKVDGIDIRDLDRKELRSLFGMVLQDTWLYSGTIADNIRYGKLDATLDEVREACKTANVDHFIKTLPDGYDMMINEDADNISGGQKQLLTIARVILADPKILILDEATSSVDTRTELLIQEAMDHLMIGRTSFIIAHRLSTIKNADMIIVMNQGDIVETGNHEELLAKDGFYAKLYNSQFEEVEEA